MTGYCMIYPLQWTNEHIHFMLGLFIQQVMFYDTCCTMHHTQCIVYSKIYWQYTLDSAYYTLYTEQSRTLMVICLIWHQSCIQEKRTDKRNHKTSHFVYIFFHIGFCEEKNLTKEKKQIKICFFSSLFLAPFVTFL